MLGYVAIDPETGAGAYIIGGSNGGLADVAANILVGLVWGAFFFASFTAGLLAFPILSVVLGIVGTLAIAGLKLSLTGDSGFNAGATLLALVSGMVTGFILNFSIELLPLGLLAPVSSIAFPLLALLGIVVIAAIVADYLFAFYAWRWWAERRRYV
ncbi:MAG: hypothetical protein AB1451_12550 [Nitrospirota bacterium]